MDTKNGVTWQKECGFGLKKKTLKMLFEFCAHFTPDRNILRYPGGGTIEKSQTHGRTDPAPLQDLTPFPVQDPSPYRTHPHPSIPYARAYKTFIVLVYVFSALTLRPKIANGLCSTAGPGPRDTLGVWAGRMEYRVALWCNVVQRGGSLDHGYGYDCGVMFRLCSIGWSIVCFAWVRSISRIVEVG